MYSYVSVCGNWLLTMTILPVCRPSSSMAVSSTTHTQLIHVGHVRESPSLFHPWQWWRTWGQSCCPSEHWQNSSWSPGISWQWTSTATSWYWSKCRPCWRGWTPALDWDKDSKLSSSLIPGPPFSQSQMLEVWDLQSLILKGTRADTIKLKTHDLGLKTNLCQLN